RQRAKCSFARCLKLGNPFIAVEVLRDVVDPNEVDAINAHALEAIVDGAPGPVGCVVVDDFVRPSVLKESALLAELTAPGLDFIQNDPSDLGAQHVLVALVLGELLAEANFGYAGAIERGSIEIARARLPCGINRRGRFLVGDIAEHVSQRRGAKAERASEKIVSDAHGYSTTLGKL